MLSCDVFMLSNTLKSKSYNDILLSCGLLNSVYVAPYADKKIYAMLMRRFLFATEIIELLDVRYRTVPIDELFQGGQKSYDRILILIPSIFLNGIDKLKPQVVYPTFVNSVYSIKSVDNGIVTMYTVVGGQDDEYVEKQLTYDQMKFIEKINCKPQKYRFMIIELGQENELTRKNIMQKLHSRMEECLTDEPYVEEADDHYTYYPGRSGYKKLTEILENFETLNKTVKSLLVGSIAAGSSFGYRREFAEAIKESGIVEDYVVGQLISAGNIWRQISRDLFKNMHFGIAVSKETLDRIDRLEEIELKAFSAIYQATSIYRYQEEA